MVEFTWKPDVRNELFVLSFVVDNFPENLLKVESRQVSGDLFLVPELRAIFRGLIELRDGQTELSEAALAVAVGESFSRETFRRVRQLPVPGDVDYHAEKLKLDSFKSGLLGDTGLFKTIRDPKSTADEVRRALLQPLVRGGRLDSGDSYLVVSDYKKEFLSRTEGLSFRTTGFEEIDKEWRLGFVPDQLTILAGYTAMGKSTVAVNIIDKQIELDRKVFLLTSEDSLEDKVARWCACRTEIPTSRILGQSLTEEEITTRDEFLDWLDCQPVVMWDSRNPTLGEFVAHTEMASMHLGGLDLIVIDQFSEFAEIINSIDNKHYRIEQGLHVVRDVAQRLGAHVVVVAQCSREARRRKKQEDMTAEDLRPQIFHLFGSSAYERKANNILMVHRPRVFDPSLPEETLELIIRKQRLGRVGAVIEFYFDGSRNKIYPRKVGAQQFDPRTVSNPVKSGDRPEVRL